MPTLSEIRAQIAAIPHRYIFFTGKEIRALPEILSEREDVRAITSGMLDGDTWLAVCTNKRLVFVNRGMVYGLRQIQLPLDRIQTIDHAYGLMFGEIRVWDNATQFTLRMVLRPSIVPFVKTVQEEMRREKKEAKVMTIANLPPAMGGAPTKPQASSPAASAAMELAEQLERLAKLRDSGVLSEQEFQASKKRILG